jgi:hypothetical protein
MSYDNDLILKELDMQDDFNKSFVLDRMHASFNYTDYSLIHRWNTLVNLLKDEDQGKHYGYLVSSMEQRQVVLAQEVEIEVRKSQNKLRCHVLGIGDTKTFYWWFQLPYRYIVLKIHHVLEEGGILGMWQDMWLNYQNLYLARKKRESYGKSNNGLQVIELENLATFFTIYGIFLSLAIILFIGEMVNFWAGRKIRIKEFKEKKERFPFQYLP